jgi:hypothetical protein
MQKETFTDNWEDIKMSKKLTIKETLDIFNFVETTLGELIAHKSDDGKIDTGEWLKTAVSTAPSAIKAVMGMQDVIAEMQDIDDAEMKILAGRGVSLAQKLLMLLMPGAIK